jgi:hypothetical protein
MKQAGFVYALYVEGSFVEHFKTINDAKNFVEIGKISGDLKVFIKPVVYFSCKKTEGKSDV